MRVTRAGFLQRRVLSFLGIYPWKCGACGSMFLYPSRGQRVRRERRKSEMGGVEPVESPQTH